MAVAPCLAIGAGEPVLVDIGLELILRMSGITVPEIGLPESNLIKHPPRQTRLVIGKLLGIVERPLDTHDQADLAAQEIWRPAVPECHSVIDPDQIARAE